VAAGIDRGARQVPGVDAITARRAACGAGAKPWAISTCWSPGPAAHAALERFVKYPRVEEVLGAAAEKQGQRQSGREGLQVDVARAVRQRIRRRDAILHRQQGP